jgi:hypothetical protein
MELWPQFIILSAMAAAVLLGATARFRRSTASGG